MRSTPAWGAATLEGEDERGDEHPRRADRHEHLPANRRKRERLSDEERPHPHVHRIPHPSIRPAHDEMPRRIERRRRAAAGPREVEDAADHDRRAYRHQRESGRVRPQFKRHSAAKMRGKRARVIKANPRKTSGPTRINQGPVGSFIARPQCRRTINGITVRHCSAAEPFRLTPENPCRTWDEPWARRPSGPPAGFRLAGATGFEPVAFGFGVKARPVFYSGR